MILGNLVHSMQHIITSLNLPSPKIVSDKVSLNDCTWANIIFTHIHSYWKNHHWNKNQNIVIHCGQNRRIGVFIRAVVSNQRILERKFYAIACTSWNLWRSLEAIGTDSYFEFHILHIFHTSHPFSLRRISHWSCGRNICIVEENFGI